MLVLEMRRVSGNNVRDISHLTKTERYWNGRSAVCKITGLPDVMRIKAAQGVQVVKRRRTYMPMASWPTFPNNVWSVLDSLRVGDGSASTSAARLGEKD